MGYCAYYRYFFAETAANVFIAYFKADFSTFILNFFIKYRFGFPSFIKELNILLLSTQTNSKYYLIER